MSPAFRQFLVCAEFTEEMVSKVATYPDLLDHDNLAQNAEIHHAHSYKLDSAGKWIDGDCLKTLEGLCAFALDAWKEYGKVTAWPLAWMTRYALAKATHYRVDALTYPHLHRGAPWSHYHTSFEAHMDRWIKKHADDLGDFTFVPYSHVYKDCRKTALESWKRGAELVERLAGIRAGINPAPTIRLPEPALTDGDCLMAARSCVQGIGDLWTTLALQMGV
jgi:hypothetical protein